VQCAYCPTEKNCECSDGHCGNGRLCSKHFCHRIPR
jgi:hypothetical protein